MTVALDRGDLGDPDARVAELYGHRWQVETCFGHLKTTMGMNTLRCKTLDGVTKELAVYLIVYNLIRGCNPAPGAWSTLDGKILQIFDELHDDGITIAVIKRGALTA